MYVVKFSDFSLDNLSDETKEKNLEDKRKFSPWYSDWLQPKHLNPKS